MTISGGEIPDMKNRASSPFRENSTENFGRWGFNQKYFLLHEDGGIPPAGARAVFAASPPWGKFLEFSRVFHRFPTQTDIEHKATSRSRPPKGPLSPEVDTESRKSNLNSVEKSELLPKGNLLIGSEFRRQICTKVHFVTTMAAGWSIFLAFGLK